MNDHLFEDEMMGPERLPDRAQVDSDFLASRPDQGISRANAGAAEAPPVPDAHYQQWAAGGFQVKGAPTPPRRGGSMRRPGATSLEPMAFGRERAGSVVGDMDAPYTPDILRNDDEDVWFDATLERMTKGQPEAAKRGPQAAFLKARMGLGNPADVLRFGDGRRAPERAPLTQDEMFEEGDKLGYQQDASDMMLSNLSERRHHQFWTRAHPRRPDQGAFMSQPDAGWDRVKSRGFLGIPWFFSMLGSKLFGTKGGRYDQRKTDLARRNGTFERARETYGSTMEGRQGVMPDWIQQSTWARDKWTAQESRVNPFAGMSDEQRRLMRLI